VVGTPVAGEGARSAIGGGGARAGLDGCHGSKSTRLAGPLSGLLAGPLIGRSPGRPAAQTPQRLWRASHTPPRWRALRRCGEAFKLLCGNDF